MKKILFSIFFFILFSCSKEYNNDCVVLNYEYDLNKKVVYFNFENKTKEKLGLLVPNQLSFLLYNKTVERARLNINKKVPNYISARLVEKGVSLNSSSLLLKCYFEQYNKEMKDDLKMDMKMDEYIKQYKSSNYSILNINEYENKKIVYKLDLNDSTIKISENNKFEQPIPKMRILLNNPYFLEVLKTYINLNKTEYRLYLQDYCIKDSLLIRM